MKGGGGGGGAPSFVACLRNLAIDHASLSRRSAVPTPDRDTSNSWALIASSPCIAQKRFANFNPLPDWAGRGGVKSLPRMASTRGELGN